MRRAPVLVLSAAFAAAVLALAFAGVDGSSGGRGDRAGEGCGGPGCHAPVASASVAPVLEGLPEEYTPGETYLLTVRIEGAPDPLPPALNAGGFALHATDGALAAPPGDALVKVGDDGNATHTAEGAKRREWQVVWAAPPPTGGTVTFTLSVNAVNGNALADPLDAWNVASVTSREGALPAPPTPAAPEPEDASAQSEGGSAVPGPGALVVLAVALLVAARVRRST